MLNTTGEFMANADPVWTAPDGLQLPTLVIPNGRGPWAMRYLWVKHRTNNDEFLANYFNKGNNSGGTGLNLRKNTAHLAAWAPHNSIFEESRDNGNLVWRVKVFNQFAQSIDIVEVWRSPLIIRQLFGDLKSSTDAETGTVRTDAEKKELREGLYNSGFEVRSLRGRATLYPLVGPRMAIAWYKHFVQRYTDQDKCIINTPYNYELNPPAI